MAVKDAHVAIKQQITSVSSPLPPEGEGEETEGVGDRGGRGRGFNTTGLLFRVGYAKRGTIPARNTTNAYINKRYCETEKFSALASKWIKDYRNIKKIVLQ